jgi:hypothetical protein
LRGLDQRRLPGGVVRRVVHETETASIGRSITMLRSILIIAECGSYSEMTWWW